MTVVDGIDLSWGIEALRERLRGAHIAHGDLERRYNQLAAEHGRLHQTNQRLYELLSPEVKAAITFAQQEAAAESRTRLESLCRGFGANT